MRDFSTDIADVLRRIGEAEKYLKVAELRERLAALEAEVARPELWNDQAHAKRVNRDRKSVV